MKRYIVFAGAHYYPRGGPSDIKQICDTLEEARASYWELVDSDEWDTDWVKVRDHKKERQVGFRKR